MQGESSISNLFIHMMGTFLFLLFLIHHTIANESSLMSPQVPEDALASSVFLPADPLAQIPGNYLSTSAWKSGKVSNSEPGLEPTSTEGPELPILAGNDIAICNSRIRSPPDQTFAPSRSRRLARFKKRKIPDFCNFQPTDQPVVAPQNLEEGGTSDLLTPSPEVPGPRIPGKSNSASPEEPLKGPSSSEEMRALIYLFPGTNGEPNSNVCSILLKPLHKVPICAPPHPTRHSFADVVSPARLCEFLFPIFPTLHYKTPHISSGPIAFFFDAYK